MKGLIYSLLALSLVVNAALASLLLAGHHRPTVAAAVVATKADRSAAPTADGAAWGRLDSSDLNVVISRLRAAGFPPNVIRAIIAAQLHEAYASRIKALTGDMADAVFWKNRMIDPKARAALAALRREEQNELKTLLGSEAADDDAFPFHRQSLSFLSAEKADEVRRIVGDFDARRAQVYSEGSFDPAKNAALDKEQRTALAAVLTPEELLNYDLRNSNTARSLREQLRAFDPSEAEFRAIYQLRAAFDQQYEGAFFSAGPTARRQIAAAQSELNVEIKAALTPDRAAVYDKLTNYNYVVTTQLVARLGLPPETADALYGAQLEFQQQQRDLFRATSTSASPDSRAQQLTELQQQALARVTSVLGSASAVDAYKRYGGQWLQSLAPRPRVAPPPPEP